MNKNDIKLIVFLVVAILIFFLFKTLNNTKDKIAYVYYNDNIIKEIDLSKNGKYNVKGYNGNILLEVKDNKIRVLEENSKRHLCSKEGFKDVIVCLPNKIVIKVVNNDTYKLDGVVK